MGIIAKQSIKGTIVTYIGVAIGFITTFFVLTRFLTTEEVGLARVLIDAATMFVGLAQLGSGSSIIRFFPYFEDKPRKDHGFFLWTIIIPFLGFLFFAIIYWACHVPISNWFGEKSPQFVAYYYAVLPIAFFMLYQTIFEANANVLMHIVLPRAVREIGVRIGMLIAYLLYAFHILTMDGFVIVICAVYALCALIDIVYLFTLGHISLRPDWAFLKENKQLIRQYIFYAGFLIVSALVSFLAPTLSSFFITAQMGLSYTGIFAIATYMSVMVSIPYRSMTAIASPQLAAAIKDNDQVQATHLMRQCCNNLLLIGGFILLAIWINIDLIYTILPNGDTYSSAKFVVLILGLSQLILAAFNISISALNYSKYYAYNLFFSLLLTVLAILLNNYLIPIYGMDGAAISNLISYIIYIGGIILTIYVTSKITPVSVTQIKITILLTIIMALNFVWQHYFPITNLWVSSLVRSFVLLGGGMWIAYKKQLSQEINALLRSIFIFRH